MKLSMWVIANQLRSFDLEINIDHPAPMVLSSARRAYATNCVHVYQEGPHVICRCEENYFRIKNIDVDLAFELVQSIFDFFAGWQDTLLNSARAFDFDEVIKACAYVFHSPIVILDSSFRVISMSEEEQFIDDEWHYLKEYRCSSPETVHNLYINERHRKLSASIGAQRYTFGNNPDRKTRTNCISTQIVNGDEFCGRITVVETDRRLNTGDIQLLDLVTRYISVYLSSYNKQNQSESVMFFKFLLGNTSYGSAEDEMKWLYDYMQWKKGDHFRIAVLLMKDCSVAMKMVAHSRVKRLMPFSFPSLIDDQLIIFMNQRIYPLSEYHDHLEELADDGSYQVMIGAEFPNFRTAPYFYDQVIKAANLAQMYHTPELIDFHAYAIRYLIDTNDEQLLYYACHPLVRYLSESSSDRDRDSLVELKVYLENDRSISKTAQALYIHKNTLVYRFKKMQDAADCDFSDPYTREYLLLSLRTVQLLELKRMHFAEPS